METSARCCGALEVWKNIAVFPTVRNARGLSFCPKRWPPAAVIWDGPAINEARAGTGRLQACQCLITKTNTRVGRT
jgi:hypothetical protein